jgi:hypothetical protein
MMDVNMQSSRLPAIDGPMAKGCSSRDEAPNALDQTAAHQGWELRTCSGSRARHRGAMTIALFNKRKNTGTQLDWMAFPMAILLPIRKES